MEKSRYHEMKLFCYGPRPIPDHMFYQRTQSSSNHIGEETEASWTNRSNWKICRYGSRAVNRDGEKIDKSSQIMIGTHAARILASHLQA